MVYYGIFRSGQLAILQLWMEARLELTFDTNPPTLLCKSSYSYAN